MTIQKRSEVPQRVTRVLLVDDHPIVRRGVAELIGDEMDLEVCGEADSVSAALELLRTVDPDVVVVDLTLSDAGGLGLIRDMRRWKKDLVVLVLSMHDEILHAERALRAGASGYVMKHQATDRIVDAIRRVLQGEIYLSDRMKERILHRMLGDREGLQADSPLDSLTDRELEIFQLIGRGLSTREMAERLCLSVKTVETHLDHIKSKLGLESGRELLRFSMSWSMEQA